MLFSSSAHTPHDTTPSENHQKGHSRSRDGMDPVSALGVAASVVQFVEVGTKVVSIVGQLYQSSGGATAANVELVAVTNDLVQLNDELKTAPPAGDAGALEKLCKSCNDVAGDLLEELEGLKVKGNGKRRIFQSIGIAVRALFKEKKITDLQQRLGMIREQLSLHVVIDLR